jgi:predicted component of type VI protein secretion system
MPSLNIQLPGFPPVSHVLKDETITIGRMKGNTIVIEDSSISLMHAKITRKDGEYFLKDLNSTNGTILNGQPLGEARLRDMDRVRFAGIAAQFVADALAPAPVPVAQAVPGSAPPTQPILPVASVPAATPVPATATAIPAAAMAAAALPLKIASPGVPASPLTSPPAPALPSVTTRLRNNRNAVRALAVAAAAIVLVLGLGGWMYFHGREGANKFASRASAQNVTKSRSADGDSRPSNSKAGPAPVKPVLETDGQGAAPTVAQWAKALKSADPAERRQAATSLHSAGLEAKAAIPELRAALKDSDPDVQLWSALALVNTQTYDRAVIPILVRSLQNSNSVVRQVACLSLGLIPYEGSDKDSVVPTLAEVAGKDSDQEVRQAAKSALGIIAPELTDTASSK